MDELRPVSLTDAARRLGVDPFEVVRLLVASDAMPDGQPFLTSERVEHLRELGGIEPSWWNDVRMPEDNDVRRKHIRVALRLMLERGVVGDAMSRLDNVSRGLPMETQRWVSAALRCLADEGLLRLEFRPTGPMVAVVAGAEARVRTIADGNEMPPRLTSLLEG